MSRCTLPTQRLVGERPVAAQIRAPGRSTLLVLFLALLLWSAAWPAGAQVLLFNQALTASATADGEPDWSQAKSVRLPDDWADATPRPSGTVVYRLLVRLDGAHPPSELQALYIERACSALEVSVNGARIYRGGRLTEPVSRHCQQPQIVAIPAALLRNGANTIDLGVRGYTLGEVSSRQRAGGLSEVELGPHDHLQQRYQRRMLFAVRLPEMVAGTLLLLGGAMVAMGLLARRHGDLAYFGAMMVGWALVLSRLWLTELPWSHAQTELSLAVLMSLITWAAVQFLVRYAGRRLRWLDVALPAQALLMLVTLWLAGPARLYPVSGLWFLVLSLEIAAAAIFYLLETRRRSQGQLWLMGPLLAVVGVALATEFLAQQTRLDARVGYVAQLIPSLVFITLALRLLQRYGRALESAEQGRAELEVRIREATAQIERNFAQLSELKVEQVTDRERKRIAADLHDDLGAKLLTIVHTSDNERISTLAREALEEMRLSVRGLTGKPVRLSDALGDWRAEVVSRLTQSGVEGEWHAPPDEEVAGTLSARAYVQTTRILREAISNIIKHSRASRCTVTCALADGDFQLVVQDNGRGIPLELDGRLDKGHGMASMKGRAKQLQGQCLVESGPGYGTVIRLTLPLDRHVTSG